MTATRKKRIRPAFLGALAAVGAVTLWHVLIPVVRSWRVEHAISRFEKRPSQAHADALVRLLEVHTPSDEQGSRALALLLRPTLMMRETYAVGQPVMVSTERPFTLNLHGVLWQEETISINDRQGGTHDGLGRLDERPQLKLVGAYEQPGTYRIDVRCRHAIGIERTRGTAAPTGHLRRILSLFTSHAGYGPAARTYRCDFTTSTEVTIVPEHEAQKVELVSSPELDRTMEAAFGIGYRGLGDAAIAYEDMPVDAAFTIVLRMPDGREIPGNYGDGKRFLARAGTSGSIDIAAREFPLGQPGEHSAALVLRPDPDYAWADPAIKAIWDGTLEFPVSFRIDVSGPVRTSVTFSPRWTGSNGDELNGPKQAGLE